ncbi:hypothetical protein LguiB_006686 [Lonicera macranthoides]
MKRKRGRPKKPSLANTIAFDNLDNNAEFERPKKPSLATTPVAFSKPGCLNANHSGFDNFNNAEFESQMESDSQQTDTDMNGLEEGLEKIIKEITADNANSLRKAFAEMISKKAGGTSKLSRDFSSSRINMASNAAVVQGERTRPEEPRLPHQDPHYGSSKINTDSNAAVVQGGRTHQEEPRLPHQDPHFGSSRINTAGNAAAVQRERTRQEEPRLPHQDPQYKEQELNDSLVVIKKIMKMDAAAPFNIPVNPIALGIPDYFDIIDTPMDFGTICNNLEKGLKYKNSEDVFKDVEYIWENCSKYNKKGDYILELMKRVKANFMKHWAAAGLYREQQQTTNGYSHTPPPSEPTVRHSKWMQGCLAGQANENPNHQQPDQMGLQEVQSHQPSSIFSQPYQPQQSSDEQQPSEEHADVITGTAEIGSSSTKRRGRGPTRCLKVWNTVGRIHIDTNDLGQPIGFDAPKLSNFLGTMARDGLLAPLIYSDWRAMPDANKENMWQQVELKFDIDPKSKCWVLDSLAKKWRNWKCMLKAAHYNTHTTDEERLADRDERVLPDQWEYLISYWNSEEGEKRSAINKEIRARQKFNHTTGTKSFARVREEEKEKRPDGKEPTWAELFILTRTRKDGKPVNEASSTLISQLRECGTQQQGALENGVTPQDEILCQLTGNGRTDRLLTYGIDVAGASALGRKPTRIEAIRMASEANAEVHEMKERMVAMEQTCAHMAEQMAKMMSMMMSSINPTDPTNKLPNVVSDTSAVPEGVPLHQVRTQTSHHVTPSRETRARKKGKHTASTSVMNSHTK